MTTTTDTALPSRRLAMAIAFLAAGFLFASLSGALLKVMVVEMHPLFMAAWRYFFYFACIAPFAMARHGMQVFFPPRAAAQTFRGVMIMLATLFFIVSVMTLPLATAIAIVYVYPFLIVALSPLVLGEKVPAIAWAGVALGFAGVLVVMRPDVGGISLAALAAFAGGATYAFYLMFTRKLAASAPPLVATGFMAVVSFVLLLPGALYYWQTPSLYEIAMLAMMGAVNALSHYLILMAFSRAEASALAPFSYMELVWGTMWGFVFFADLPDALTFGGIALIIISGVMVAQSARIARLITRRRGSAG